MSLDFVERLFAIARSGGDIALSFIADSSPMLKSDHSVLTKADLAVSALVRQRLADLLATEEHILIDEEDKNNRQYFDQPLLDRTPYVWAVDPIDGTRPYSQGMPLYGISLGLLKNAAPYLGMVYFPSLRELFYCDGEKSFFIEQAFTAAEKKREIVVWDPNLSAQSVFFLSDNFFKNFSWDYQLCPVMAPSCAVVDLCWPAIGRGSGCFFNANLWDFAGSWPILRAAGFDMRTLATGRVLERITTADFWGEPPKTWWLKENFVISSARNFPLIQKAIQRRKDSR